MLYRSSPRRVPADDSGNSGAADHIIIFMRDRHYTITDIILDERIEGIARER